MAKEKDLVRFHKKTRWLQGIPSTQDDQRIEAMPAGLPFNPGICIRPLIIEGFLCSLSLFCTS